MDHSSAPTLSLRERKRGHRYYYAYSLFNAISYGLLAEGLVVLILLRLGGSEAWVGGTSALLYLTMPIMLLGYKTIPRLGVTGTAGAFWAGRSLSAGLMILAPWASGYWGNTIGLWFVFFGSFGFMAGRAGGMVAFTGIVSELSTSRTRGDLISNSFKINQSGQFVVTGLIALILGASAPLFAYQGFFAVGVVAGLLAAVSLFRIPESGVFKTTSSFRPRDELRWVFAERGRRWFFAMMISIPMIQGITRTFMILVAKQGYGLSDQIVVLFVLAGMTGGIAASYTYSMFLDQLGSRPLMVITGFLDIAGVVLIIMLPQALSFPLLALIFFLGGYTHIAFQASIQHYFISITTTQRQLPQGILAQGFGGLAGGAALVLGGLALEQVRQQVGADSMDPLLHFRWFYGGVMVLLFMRTVIFIKLPPLQSQGIRDSLNALFSPWDWRAIHAVKRAISIQSEDVEEAALKALMRTGSGIYREELTRYLESPSIVIRQRAMDGLSIVRPNEALVAALMKDLQVNQYTTAHQSAYWLGRWQIEKASPLLMEALDSPDFMLQGKAMHALVEMEDRDAMPLIEARFAASDNPYVLIEGARGLSLWGNHRHYAILLQKYHLDIPPQAKDELSLSVTRLLGLYDAFYRDLAMLHREPEQLYREWEDRYAKRDAHGLVSAFSSGEPRRTKLLATLEHSQNELTPWFVETTRDFLEKRPEKVWPVMAFMMTFLLLNPEGKHRPAQEPEAEVEG